jgi:chromosome partitioning protein
MFDGRTNLSSDVVAEVRRHFPEQVFDAIIPRTVRLAEAPSYGQPITVYAPNSNGAQAYAALAREVLEEDGLHIPIDKIEVAGDPVISTPDKPNQPEFIERKLNDDAS